MVALLAVAGRRAVAGWRAGRGRRALVLGSVAGALMVINLLLAVIPEVDRYDEEPLSAVYVPAVLLFLLAGVLIGEERPVALGAARLTLTLGLLLGVPFSIDFLQHERFALLPHAALLLASAMTALAALYSPTPPPVRPTTS
jgi:hypothetical protein